MFEDAKEQLAKMIAGEVVLSNDPGQTLRKWREIFDISQTDLAHHLNISPSVVSDYEGGRRKSPGSATIRKVVESLIELDISRGGRVIHSFSHRFAKEVISDVVLDLKEFPVPIPSKKLIEAVDGEILANEKYLNKEIHGYTVIDSIKAILNLNSEEFLKLYGLSSERALIFTKVSTGRSPMIAIKVQGIIPSMVVLHGAKKVDEIAVKLAELQKIPLILSRKETLDDLLNGLRTL
ncbi:MAG TPA: helix-turn-helix domain-containing protein [Methanofastidiosum sp.]|jgi:putative transcriptional regulator|nr:helix-turn-helix domain-containing protein [Methanofastidiosum sp.]HNZ87038.1 helix-turn-helix domain-containing protein [Methanofastidiosum sp.]HOC78445.1 helix-turn-helix domain-containing protein [Methanofastidiosum sp.]HOG73319.1 helix-turn-helix domain-containing protein [Methanofastidiosum sp.]HPA48652.1 helix-turn-helix domain-containing protein [Methanofastidiosum sp.]